MNIELFCILPYCQTFNIKTMNTMNVYYMYVMTSYNTKIRTSGQAITVAACTLVFPHLIGSSHDSRNISCVHSIVTFTVREWNKMNEVEAMVEKLT